VTTKKNKDLTREKILQFCSTSRKAKEIGEFLGINQNTIRAHYLYPMVKNGMLKRVRGVSYYIKNED
jgi:predicted ArsR family transcriptional regulator